LDRKSVELAKDDIKQLYSCLLTCIDYPKELLSKSMMDNLIAKLTNVKNSRVDQVLGKYYLKNERVKYLFIIVIGWIKKNTNCWFYFILGL